MSKLKFEIENRNLLVYFDDEKMEFISKIFLSRDLIAQFAETMYKVRK